MALATQNKPRKNFSRINPVIDYPDLLGIQVQSFRDFFSLDTSVEDRSGEGLYKVFAETSQLQTLATILSLSLLIIFWSRLSIRLMNLSIVVLLMQFL